MALAGGRARRPLVVQVHRVDFVTPKAGQNTCGGLSVARHKRATGAGHQAEPGPWREDVAGSECRGAIRSHLEAAGQLCACYAECGLLGSGEGGTLETWRTRWARSMALAGGATYGGGSALRLFVLLVRRADSLTSKMD